MPFALSHPPDTAERVEGEPFFQLSCYTIQNTDALPPLWRDLSFCVRAFKVLPPCDAVGLLSGNDSTGLVVWSGALALLEWLMRHPDNFDAACAKAATDGKKGEAHIIELGCGSGVATVGLAAMLARQWQHRMRGVGAPKRAGAVQPRRRPQRRCGGLCGLAAMWRRGGRGFAA